MSGRDEWAEAVAEGLAAVAERLAALRAGGEVPVITVNISVPRQTSGWTLLDVACAHDLMPAAQGGTWLDHRQYGLVHVEAHLRHK